MALIKLRKWDPYGGDWPAFLIGHNLIMSVAEAERGTAIIRDITGKEFHVVESVEDVMRLIEKAEMESATG